jgi:cysteine synthase A
MGHPFYAVMSAGNSRERTQMIRAFGGNVILVSQRSGGTPGCVTAHDMRLVRERAAELVVEKGAFFVDQFENPDSPWAHEKFTAREFWEQCDGDLDAIVMFVGSGAALGGLSRGLRAFKPDLRAYVVEPEPASLLVSGCCSDVSHTIQEGGYEREKLAALEGVHIDGHLVCSDANAAVAVRSLAIYEGILAGYSTGAQMHAAAELLRGPERGSTIGFLVCDSGLKYLSTELYS